MSGPAEFFCRLGAIGVVGVYVSRAARVNNVGDILATCAGEGLDDIKDRASDAGTEVEDLNTLATVHPCKCCNVAGSQVADVNVVAHAGAVRGVVVVAKDRNGLSLANGGLSHVRNEVIRNARGIFADKSGLVGANGVEVAEQNNVPCGICGMNVGEDLFNHPFCPAVWVGSRFFGALFSQG